jgi:ATP-dependent exoDNAse (exonuclease V) alpha subunit
VRALLRERAVTPPAGRRITRLYSHNADVDRINEEQLALLPGGGRSYLMRGFGAPPLIESLKRNCLSPEELKLKVGAKIIFTKNDMEGRYFNGTTGEVTGFNKLSGNPVVSVANGTLEVEPVEWAVMDGHKKLAHIEQLPLRLAWAITVHKSQGMSLDAAHIDLSQAFEYGQGYVALSRVRTLNGLYLAGFNERALEVHPDVAEHDSALRAASDEAADAFERMPKAELGLLHKNFVHALGGKLAA